MREGINNRMSTTFLLHGGKASRNSDLNERFRNAVIDYLDKEDTFLICLFAKKNVDPDVQYATIVESYSKNEKSIKFELADVDIFKEQVKQAKAIYFVGGNTLCLLETLQSVEFERFDLNNKLVIGSSAGALVLGTYFFSQDENAAFSGLSLLPCSIITHFERNKSMTDITTLKVKDEQIPVLSISEEEYTTIVM